MRSVSHSARVLPLAAVPLLLQPSAALADESEFWMELAAKGEIAPGTSLKLEVEERRKNGPNEYILGAVVDTEVGDGFSIGGGVEVHDTDGFSEIRPYQQVGYSSGILSLRTRIEERFYDRSDRMALRLRQRVQLSDEIAPRLKAAGSVELLYPRGGSARRHGWLSAAAAPAPRRRHLYPRAAGEYCIPVLGICAASGLPAASYYVPSP